MPRPGHRKGITTQYHPILIRFGRLSDMVMLEPLLELLHRRYGQRCWLIGSGPWARALYAAHANVARTFKVHGSQTETPEQLFPGLISDTGSGSKAPSSCVPTNSGHRHWAIHTCLPILIWATGNKRSAEHGQDATRPEVLWGCRGAALIQGGL